MVGIVGAHHTSFTVAELDRSLVFLRDRLSLMVVSTRAIDAAYFGQIVGCPGCRVRAALLRIPGSAHLVELFEYQTPPGSPCQPLPWDPGSAHLSLLVDDRPALYQQLRAQGVAFVSSPVRIDAGPDAGGYRVYLRDPNGILIELFQSPPARSPEQPADR
jgi:catechol 2,3-dioxygenase-like lactoylglutathione lyase family enzyme